MMARLLTLIFALFAQQPGSPPEKAEVDWQTQSACPISEKGLDGSKKHFVDFEGQRIYVCSKQCINRAAKIPELMIASLARSGEAPESINTICPVAGETLQNRHHMVWVVGNKSFAVCCKKCARKATSTPATYLDRLEGRVKQTLCPISGDQIHRHHFVDLEGFRVHGCSEACLIQIQSNPPTAFAKLAQQKVVLEPRAKTCHLNPREKRNTKVFVTRGAKRHYFCCTKCQGKWLAKQVTSKVIEESAGGALDFLGGSLDGGQR
ncbi:MAG: hypothetical protein MK209_03390 [Planctomycetes bacterium]|nr:hypothetical protein [Planctomycetota bacterium]